MKNLDSSVAAFGHGLPAPMTERLARLIAFYLPQYHPVPENNEFWGSGFTEWTNAAKARPLFKGHVQPHLPSDLGFYDLRLPETREQQADLARSHGIEAFCYYHYWFNGRRILERPFEEVLRSGAPDFPFCLCWANESWSGIWHGAPKRILIEQTYNGEVEARAHFAVLLPAFRDLRYLCVDGRPVFIVYKPSGLPDAPAFARLWRQLASEAGLPGLYLIGCGDQAPFEPHLNGFDAVFRTYMPNVRPHVSLTHPWRKLRFKLQEWRGLPTIFDYDDVVHSIFPDPFPDDAIPVVIPNWDNTPRSGVRGRVLRGSSPERFRPHLAKGIAIARQRAAEERLLFVKSWNEWAEGNYLEPDLEFGRAWLDVVDQETRV